MHLFLSQNSDSWFETTIDRKSRQYLKSYCCKAMAYIVDFHNHYSMNINVTIYQELHPHYLGSAAEALATSNLLLSLPSLLGTTSLSADTLWMLLMQHVAIQPVI